MLCIAIIRTGSGDGLAQIKSRQRVVNHGEVFTADREVKAMCDLVSDECLRIDSRFLEPACGDGNFLSEILDRKLAIVKERYRRSPYDWERNALLALGSLYGVDLLTDNCIVCRKRLFDQWDAEYKKVCKRECNDEVRRTAKFILDCNIVCGNALTLRCVDDDQQDTIEPIVFSEWSFPNNDAMLHRKDYTFSELLESDSKDQNIKKTQKTKETAQQSLFDDSSNKDGEGTFVKEYVCHYRRLGEVADAKG